MDIIRLAITCKYCHEILESPVVLPCGESICEKDIATKDSEFCCFSCGKNHVIPVGGFSPNKAFALVLNTRIAELDIGQEQNRARNESFKRVQKTLSELKLSLTDPDFIIVEPIEELKRRVELKKEELVLKIEEEAGTLIDELCAFERTCKSNHRTNEEMLDRARNLDDKVRRCEDEIEEWRNEMKVLKIDEAKWREVNGICDKLVADLEVECEGWKEALLMNKIRDFDYKIAELESVDFDPKNKLDSRILNLKQRRELLDLCDFPFNSNWKLLYRASEHGFSVARFHEKCNNKPNTLTLIESSNGNIFGGFCAAKWSPSMKFIKDKSAFIFSLVNGEETPLKIDIDQGDENCAVQCHEEIGPIFGGVSINGGDRDIYIADQANTNTVSYSDLGRCYKHKNYAHGSNRARCFLAGSHNFQVSNIEVYQRI